MTTALQIINRAYSMLGYKAAGEDLAAADADYALETLNSLIDSWNTARNYIWTVTHVSAVVSGASATIGTGLNFDTAWPVDMENGGFTRQSTSDYQFEWISRERYDKIPTKGTTGTFPEFAYYDGNQTIYFYPQPSSATIYLPVQSQLTQFADIGTDYTLKTGYKRALEYTLAEELAPGIREPSPMVVRNAAAARAMIRRMNVRVPQMDSKPRTIRPNIFNGI